MRKLNVLLSMAMISAVSLSLYGCIIVDSPMKGWIYTETKYGEFATTHDVATKEGKACGRSLRQTNPWDHRRLVHDCEGQLS
jgi:hypothetical protein